jgi:hypothetical protein
MSHTPRTDALIVRHEGESFRMQQIVKANPGAIVPHAVRQVHELIDHARALEESSFALATELGVVKAENQLLREEIAGGHCIRREGKSPCESMLAALKALYADVRAHEKRDPNARIMRVGTYADVKAAIAKAEGK